MYRLATLLALLIALAVVGCGGSGNDSDSAPSAVATGDSASSDDTGDSESKREADKTDADKKSSKDEHKDEDEEDDGPKTHEEVHEEQEEAYAKLPLERKAMLVETVVRSAALSYGLKVVDVKLRRGGRAATATVARKGACSFVASQEPNLALTIKEGVPGLKSIRLLVAGTGKEIGYYVLGCKKPEIPSGAGRVVLDHSGVGGPYTSKPFKIKSKRWALEWENHGSSLAVILAPLDKKAKENYAKPVGSKKTEAGRYEYTGGGKYRIQAYGAGGWRVRVKEIG
jgi:hypothetical protein